MDSSADSKDLIFIFGFIVFWKFLYRLSLITQEEFFCVAKVTSKLIVEKLQSAKHDAWKLVVEFEEVLLLNRLD